MHMWRVGLSSLVVFDGGRSMQAAAQQVGSASIADGGGRGILAVDVGSCKILIACR